MKCVCPACRRTTSVEAGLIDFFMRCERCGILLRPREEGEGVRVTAKIVAVGKVREAPANANGALAALLCRPVTRGTAAKNVVAPKPEVVSPEKGMALRRAALRHHHRMLGVMGACGSAVVVLLGVGLMAIKARELMRPRTAVADVVRAGEEIRMTKRR